MPRGHKVPTLLNFDGTYMSYVFFSALISGLIAQLIFGRVVVSIVIPIIGYIAWSVFNEFFVPYQGGGASFWPLDMVFACPVAGAGSALGTFLAIVVFKARHDIKAFK
jgi:hypothetical protein